MEQLFWLIVIACVVLLVLALIKKTFKIAIVIAITLIIASYFGIQISEVIALKDNPVVIEMMEKVSQQPDNIKMIYETYKEKLPEEVVESIEKYGINLVLGLFEQSGLKETTRDLVTCVT